MIVAGEPSGDVLAAELVKALQNTRTLTESPGVPKFFGAGGPAMADAGVEILADLTQHAMVGVSDILRHYLELRRIFKRLFRAAMDRAPDAIILVDYSGFNLRFARAVKGWVRRRTAGAFYNWTPKIVYYISPQVWASREGRVRQIAANVDLLLSIFPFEKEWYASRAKKLRVEFVGHPMVDRYAQGAGPNALWNVSPGPAQTLPLVLLLPGSRKRELEAHLPVMIETVRKIQVRLPIRLRMVLPNPELVKFALQCIEPVADLEIQTAKLAESLAQADLAIAASGTITMECAYFGVPTVVIYITSRLTYEIARRIITVRHIAMPNIMAGQAIYPEFIQNQVQPDKLAQEAIDLLRNTSRRQQIKEQLRKIVESLGAPGAARRAAEAIVRILPPHVDYKGCLE